MTINIRDTLTGNQFRRFLSPACCADSQDFAKLSGLQKSTNTVFVTYDHGDDPGHAHTVAMERYRELSKSFWSISKYAAFDPPEKDPQPSGGQFGWYIPTCLTDLGEQALQALTNQYVWSMDNHQIDLNETETYYRFLLSTPILHHSIITIINGFADDELQPLVNDAIMFVLGAERLGVYYHRQLESV
jgi:hypothetical protein